MKQLGRKGLLATLLLAFTMCFCAALWALPKVSPAVAEEAYNNYLAGAAPEFSKSGGVYYSDDANGDNVTWGDGSSARLGNVEITTSADGAEIYYTTDGSVPTKDSTKYTGALTFSRGTYRVRAVAYKDGKYSDVSERIYYVGSENYLKGASYSYNEGYAGPTKTVWGSGVDSIDFIVSSVQNGRYAADTAAMSRGDGFTYLQLDMGEAKSVNYLTFCSFWHYGGDLSTKVWLSKIEIGDGENFTTVYQKAEGSGSPLTSSGYVAENAATSNGVVINLAIFLDSAVSGRYIRYYNEGDDLHINYVTAGSYDATPSQTEEQSVDAVVPVPASIEKVYDSHVSEQQIKEDLAAMAGDYTVGNENVALNWSSADFVADKNGTFIFYGALSSVPAGYVDLYHAAVKANVIVKEVKDQTYDDALSINNYLADAAPEFSKNGGVYYSDDANGDNVTWGDGSSARLGNVEITTSADGAEIYYTTDGSVPTKDSTKYTGALTFSRGTYRVRAVAYKDGKYSDVSERIYYVGSENYLKGASYSYNEGYAGPTNTVWGTGVDSIDFIVSSVQNGRQTMDTAAMARGDGFTYLQLDMGEAKSVNYLTFCSFWHYGGDLSTKVWLSKIEIGDGENFTTVYQKAEGSGSPLTSSGYVAENAATSNGVVINLAIFLDSAVSGRYIRYYNEGDDLHINYVTAGYYETTPAQMQGQSVPQALSVSSEYDYTKSYETGTTRFEVLTDLVTSYAAINIGGELCEVEWYAPADYDEYYGGVFNFIGVLQNLPSDIVNLYNVALTVEVSLPVKTNPTALKAYIEGLQIGAQGEYTSSTWSDYAQSLAKAQSIISALENDEAAKTQTEVDDALNELKADVAALEKLGDKTALNAKIEAVENTDTAPYTEESTAAFTDALSSARAVAASDNVTQAQVDEALQALTSAYEGLAYKADKTTLNGRIEALSAIDLSGKTSETAASFTQALNAARAVSEKADASQNEVDAALSDLNAAYSALTDRANKTALNAKISEAEAEAEKTIYTSATLAALKTALSDAETVAENANASQNEVDNALAQLNEAISALEKLGDRTALKADVSELQANKDKYTQSSWNAFSAETLNALLTVADDADASEKEVAEAAELLRAEIAKLVLRADTAALTEKLNLSLTQSDYTSASWVVYLAARNNALEVIADADALQEDADSALTALTSAIEGLEKLGDKTALNALIAEAKEKAEGKYSAESLAVLENAISDAETIAADSQASESEVEAATVSLQSAIDGLTSSGGCRSGLTPATSLLLFAVLSGFAAALTRRCARREKK